MHPRWSWLQLARTTLLFACVGCGGHGHVLPDGQLTSDGNDADDTLGDAPPDSVGQCQGPGALDPSFGNGGVVGPIFGLGSGRTSVATSVLIDPADRIVVGGGTRTGNPGDRPRDCFVARVRPDGILDPSYGVNGVARHGISNHECWHNDIAFQVDGKLVAVGGLNGPGETTRVILMRYLDDGKLDPTFGNMGMVITEPAPKSAAMAVAIDSANRLVVAAGGADGFDVGDAAYFVTLRYLPDGALDSSFGTGGIAQPAFENGDDLAYDLAIQPDGKIVVSGNAASSSVSQFGLVRYNPDGTKDASFGAKGLATVVFDGGVGGGRVALDASARAIVVGEGNAVPSQGLLARLDASGHADPSFGIAGRVKQSLASQPLTFQKVIASGQQLLAVGWSTQTTNGLLRLARYDDTGMLDPTFGSNGFAQLPSSHPWYSGLDLAEQSDSRIVVVGAAGTKNPQSNDVLIARYCP